MRLMIWKMFWTKKFKIIFLYSYIYGFDWALNKSAYKCNIREWVRAKYNSSYNRNEYKNTIFIFLMST